MSYEPGKMPLAKVTEHFESATFCIKAGLCHLALVEDEVVDVEDLSLVRQLLATAIRQITAMHKRKIN